MCQALQGTAEHAGSSKCPRALPDGHRDNFHQFAIEYDILQ